MDASTHTGFSDFHDTEKTLVLQYKRISSTGLVKRLEVEVGPLCVCDDALVTHVNWEGGGSAALHSTALEWNTYDTHILNSLL
jgi:hypothetical protein